MSVSAPEHQKTFNMLFELSFLQPTRKMSICTLTFRSSNITLKHQGSYYAW